MYEVTVNMDSLPKGADVEVDGLGMFKNGETTEVSDEAAEYFRVKHSTTTFDYDEKGNLIQETTPGPTILQAFRGVDHIDAKRVKQQKQEEPPEGESLKANETPEGGSDNA